MEIEIKEKIDSLEITKNCKQELKKISAIFIFTILFIYFLYIYYNPSMFLLFPIYVTPLAYIIFTIVCQKYKYEVRKIQEMTKILIDYSIKNKDFLEKKLEDYKRDYFQNRYEYYKLNREVD